MAIVVKLNEEAMPVLKAPRQALETCLEKVKAAKMQRDRLESERRMATRELSEQMAAARELVSRLRHLVKAELGLRDPRLKSFGIKPIQKRRPAAKVTLIDQAAGREGNPDQG
jgi:hypothetical protein